LNQKYVELLQWLDEKMAEQESKSITEEPAFTKDDVEEKSMVVANEFMKMYNKKAPKKSSSKEKANDKDSESKNDQQD